MVENTIITADVARKLLDYIPETGEFRWRERTPDMFSSSGRGRDWVCRNWNSKYAGVSAGSLNSKGYYRIGIRMNGADIRIYSHVLAWLIHYGRIPEDCEIDHINNNPKDNRIENLRVASHGQNKQNRAAQSNNSTGFKGVSLHARQGKYTAKIGASGRSVWLGSFETAEEAHAAYCAAAKSLHGEFARTE